MTVRQPGMLLIEQRRRLDHFPPAGNRWLKLISTLLTPIAALSWAAIVVLTGGLSAKHRGL